MSARPIVGVTGPDRGGHVAWLLTAYAIGRSGGRALRITPSRPAEVEALDAVVLGGGADIDTALYENDADASEGDVAVTDVIDATKVSVRKKHLPGASLFLAPAIFAARIVFEAHTRGPDPERDALETMVLERAVARDLPILGICRGAQLMNVHFGGTLYQDLTDFYVEAPQLRTVLPRKKVTLTPGSHLARLLGGERARVNALHHQAIKVLGEGLRVVAKEDNGVVQAIEDPRHPFRIGVQWHPEYLPQDARQRAIFDALVTAARVHAQTRDVRVSMPSLSTM